MKVKQENFIYISILLWPVLDFISFLNPIGNSISLIAKGIFLGFVLFYLIKKTEHKKIFLFLGIYFFIFLYFTFTNHSTIFLEIQNLLTIFSFPIFLLFFSSIENKKINYSLMPILYFISTSFFLILSVSSISIPSSFLFVFLILFALSITYVLESHSYILKGVFVFATFFLSLYLSSKIFTFGVLLITLLVLLFHFKQCIGYIKKNQFPSFCLICIILLCGSLSYQAINFASIKNKTVYTTRIENQKETALSYKNAEGLFKVLGLKQEEVKIEADVLTLYYSIGFVGCFFYLLFLLYAFRKSTLKRKEGFWCILFFCLSFLGNVYTNFYVIFYISLVCILSKTDSKKLTKDILMVSNMYPSLEYPHYGIFTKNAYELLCNQGYKIDLVVMKKTEGKLKKFIAYVKMCGTSLLKAIFYNYDFFYVHFASHTPAGVFIPYLFSRDTKYVLNVHGNDIVADTKVDQNYLLLSRLFLKWTNIVIAPSTYFKNILIKDYKIPSTKIVVYPSGGVDCEKFKKINKKTALKNSNLDPQYKYFGFVARLEKDKGYDTYLKAIYEMEKTRKYKDIRYLLVGQGKEEENVASLIKKYRLGKKVIRLPFQTQEELVNIYNSLEAFIYPTRMKSESLGLTGLEAMACECLVIGSNKYGPSDYLIHKENSYTFNPIDAKLLEEYMIEVLSMDKKEKSKIVKNARKKSMEYSLENTKEILLNVFEKE